MTRLTNLDWATKERIKRDLESSLETLSETHGITIKMASWKDSTGGFTFFATGKLMEEASTPGGRELPVALVREMKRQGFSEDWGRFSDGREFRLVDFNARATRTPWIAENREGKRYRFSTANAMSMWKSAILFTPPPPALLAAFEAVVDRRKTDAMLRSPQPADSMVETDDFDPGEATPTPRAPAHTYDGEF